MPDDKDSAPEADRTADATAEATPPPFTNGANPLRGPMGRWAKGNPGGPGNPHVRKVASLRSSLFNAVSATDMRKVVKRLVSAAIDGDVTAAKIVLERLLGPSVQADLLDRLDQQQAAIDRLLTDLEQRKQ